MDMRIPNPAMSVTIDVPPKLTSGRGMPTTGPRPVTIAVLTKTYTKKVRLMLPAARRSSSFYRNAIPTLFLR